MKRDSPEEMGKKPLKKMSWQGVKVRAQGVITYRRRREKENAIVQKQQRRRKWRWGNKLDLRGGPPPNEPFPG